MLNIKEIINIIGGYNINSTKYGPTIYHNKNEVGLCIEIKDSLFGFLNRYFTFTSKDQLENFLKSYSWYKNNQKKYPLTLKLDKYNTPNPNILYFYNDELLTLDKMLNIDSLKEVEKNNQNEEVKKEFYLESIKELTNYFINLKNNKINNIKEKNNLKTEENDLKHELIKELSNYYGKSKNFSKKAITLEIITNNFDVTTLLNNIDSLQDKKEVEVKEYLTILINNIKAEELSEKNLINLYSNEIYKYNIKILNKQINFVKNKIASEKNFNIKGSASHNIDAELKSFLSSVSKPIPINDFLNEHKNAINNKYSSINCDNAAKILCNKTIIEKAIIKENYNEEEIKKDLRNQFDNLDSKTKARLILYNSFYKPICNFIINNNYPSIEEIKSSFDWNYYYNEISDIVYNENNTHYLTKYFEYLDFKNLDSYINSIIEICKTMNNTKMNLLNKLKIFYLEDTNKYKLFTINPIYDTTKKVFTTELNQTNNIIYIPDQIEIDENTLELFTITTKNIYLKCNIEESLDTIIVTKYNKKQIKDKENKCIITTNLIKDKDYLFNIGYIKEERDE